MLLVLFAPGPDARAGEAPGFSVTIDGETAIGGASITVDLAGSLETAAAAAPCIGGAVDSGSLAVSDSDEKHSAVITVGVVTVGCVPGFANGLYAEVRGYWETVELRSFSLRMIATRAADGSLGRAIGELVTATGRRRGAAAGFAVSGRFAGAGESTGLGGAPGATSPDSSVVDRLIRGLPVEQPSARAATTAIGGGPARGSRFTFGLDTALTLGSGKVVLALTGLLRDANPTCGYGEATKGTLTVTDADDTLRGTVENGYVYDCGKGARKSPRQITFSVGGVMNDAAATPFAVSGSGKVARDGKVTQLSVRLALLGRGAAGSVIDEVKQLRARAAVYDGGSTGTGAVAGLVPVNNPTDPKLGRSFRLVLNGHDRDDIVIEMSGAVYSDYGGPSPAYFQPEKATLTVGGAEYALRVQYLILNREGTGGARLYLVGAVTPARKPAPGKTPNNAIGFIIAEIETGKPPLDLFAKGGRLDLVGRIASLRVNEETYHPEVTGALTVNVVKV